MNNNSYKPGHLAQIAAGALATPPTLETTAAVMTALVTAIEKVLPDYQPRYWILAKTLLRLMADSTRITEVSAANMARLGVSIGSKLIDQVHAELMGTGRYPELWPEIGGWLRFAWSVPDLDADIQRKLHQIEQGIQRQAEYQAQKAARHAGNAVAR